MVGITRSKVIQFLQFFFSSFFQFFYVFFGFQIFVALTCSLNFNFPSAFPVSSVYFELVVWSARCEISKKNQISRRIGLDFSSIL